MERFVKGDIVVIPFPFSDLSRAKRRPALVVTELEGDATSVTGEETKQKNLFKWQKRKETAMARSKNKQKRRRMKLRQYWKARKKRQKVVKNNC